MITGCCRREVLGLRWEDMDFMGCRLHICNSVLHSSDIGVYQSTPKTKTSVRWVAVPPETIKLLREWKNYQAKEATHLGDYYRNNDDLLFTQDDGSPMHPDSVTTYLDRFSKKYGLSHINPHKFRHTMASMLIFNHVDPVSVSKRLGHSQVSTTTDIYAHIMEEADQRSADILSIVFLKNA